MAVNRDRVVAWLCALETAYAENRRLLTDLWTRATPPNAQAAAGYLTITNKGGAADKLVGAASPSAEKLIAFTENHG